MKKLFRSAKGLAIVFALLSSFLLPLFIPSASAMSARERFERNSAIEGEYDPTPIDQNVNPGLFEGVTFSCWYAGTCTLCDILVVMINISNLILRFFAVIALVFFLWGAGILIISSGNETNVKKGKGILTATIVGSIVVLLSWQLIAFVALVLAGDDIFDDSNRSLNPITTWYNVADQCNPK